VCPRAGLDRCGRSRLTGIRSPDRPARSSVAILTELSGLPRDTEMHSKFHVDEGTARMGKVMWLTFKCFMHMDINVCYEWHRCCINFECWENTLTLT
jgi:hypothetical protein